MPSNSFLYVFGKPPKTNSFSLNHGGDLSYFAEMPKVVRHEPCGFPPFTSVFHLQFLPESCSNKYLPNSTLLSHPWGKRFLHLFTFPALILFPSIHGRFLKRKVYTGPPYPCLPLHSSRHYSTLLPLFTNHSLKFISNLLITRWSSDFFSSLLFTASQAYHQCGSIDKKFTLTSPFETLSSLRFR